MRTLCSWCGAVIRDEDGTRGFDTHGICQECAAKAEVEIKQIEAVLRNGTEREVINPYDSNPMSRLNKLSGNDFPRTSRKVFASPIS